MGKKFINNKTDKSISKFLGWEFVRVGYFSSDETRWQVRNKDWIDEVGISNVGYYLVKVHENKFQELEYYSPDYSNNWIDLMSVIDKIENTTHNGISFNVEINKSQCEISWTVGPSGTKKPKPIIFSNDDKFCRDSKITMVYKAVVEFIKWYNQQPKN